MIQSVRSYFDTIIKEIDSDFRSDGFVFDTEFTADHNLDFTYKLNMGTMSIARQNSAIEATLPVVIWIHKVSNADKQKDDFDTTYCKAVDIMARAMNQTKIDQTEYIKAVTGVDIAPSALEDNDNSMRFTLEFSVTLNFIYTLD